MNTLKLINTLKMVPSRIVKLSCPAGQNFEIIASKILKTLVIGRKICKLRFISSPHAQLPNAPLI